MNYVRIVAVVVVVVDIIMKSAYSTILAIGLESDEKNTHLHTHILTTKLKSFHLLFVVHNCIVSKKGYFMAQH